MRYVFLTERLKNSYIRDKKLITSFGGIEVSKIRGVMAWKRWAFLDSLSVPYVIVSSDCIELKGIPTGMSIEEKVYPLLEVSIKLAKSLYPFSPAEGLKTIYEICKFQRLMFNTACAFMLLHSYCEFGLALDYSAVFKVGSLKLNAWEIAFLPTVVSLITKEFESTVQLGLEPYKRFSECVNLVLSYFIGNERFYVLFLKNLRLLGHATHLNTSKSHSGLFAHPRKL